MNKTRGMSSERGTVMVMVAVWLPILALFVSFAIDVAHFFDYSRNLQNRADAAALAAGDQYGGICFGSPSTADMDPIGKMAQLFSGPTDSSNQLPYPYSGAGSPLVAFPQYSWADTYKNGPNLSVSAASGSNYHVLLNADNYSADGGTDRAIGDFCHGNPTLDHQDKECYGQTSLSGQLAVDCATAPMIDVKLTQSNVPLFFPLTGIAPNISAHARVTLHALSSASQLLPLGVGDAAYVPCVKVQFFPAGSSTATTTIQMTLNKPATKAAGNPVWDNSTDNANTGDPVLMPAAGTYLYMKAMLYSENPTTGTCSGTPRGSVTYPQSSTGTAVNDGVLDLSAAPANPLGTNGALAPGALPQIDKGGVILDSGTGNPDQYFSSTGANSVNVTANVAFASDATGKQVLAVDTITGNQVQLTQQGATNTWTGGGLPAAALSGQHPICIQVIQATGIPNNQKSACSGAASNGMYSLGPQQETFSACNEATSGCGHDESGPIIQARIGQVTVQGGVPLVDWSQRSFAGGSSPNLIIQFELQGLSAAQRYNPVTGTGDLCANGQCTVLRLDNAGNGNGAIDCGEGNAASAMEQVMLSTCPSYSNPPTGLCTNIGYCGDWTASTDGTCNNTKSTRPASGGPVDCVNTNNGGANLPTCIAARIQTGATQQPNCNLSGTSTGCSVDHWLQGDAIPLGDPRVMSAFIVFSGDIESASGNTDVPIRQFAAFYVTGWKYQGGGQVTCPTGANPTQANEDPPASVASAQNAVWGHWITYTVPGKGDPQQICDFQAIGECTPVLSR